MRRTHGLARGRMVTWPWWVVFCRLVYDDDESCYIGQAKDREAAVEQAEAWLREDEDNADDEMREFQVLWVVRCEEGRPPERVSYF